VILRPCSPALATALATQTGLLQADLFTFTLQSATVYRWTSWDRDLVVAGNTFTSTGQYVNRGRWNVTNTMIVPTLEVTILDTGAPFLGGLMLRTQLHNGLFDGATLLLQRAIMPSPGDVTTLGTIDIFSGDVGAVTLLGAKATLKVRGKNSRLDANAPRNIYQPGCRHTFCDAGCTLNPASFTAPFHVTATPTPTRNLFGWSVGAATPTFRGGTLTFTSGANSGQARTIIDFNNSAPNSVTLSTPLPFVPANADTFTVFLACDKTLLTCDSIYSNKVNFLAFPYIPPPATTAPGQ
jgi:uncharacterized phage protein (TIGR02218 family)